MGCAVLLAISLIGSTPFSPAQVPQTDLVKVFVTTDDTGETSELAARRQSVTDMSEALAARKKTFKVVDAEASADLVVNVVDRGLFVPKMVIGLSPRPGDPTAIAGMAAPVRSPILRVHVTRGTQAIIFTNKNKPAESARGWKTAADDLAVQIEKWVKLSRE
jgi:hypothetical protein